MTATGRLAPTPSGHLHLGNALAFGAAWASIRSVGGRLLLRMEDVDGARARPEVEASIRDDLRWLGLDWDEETPPQRDRDYEPWLRRFDGRTYRCGCSRAELAGRAYRGSCRDRGLTGGAVRFRLPEGPVWVIDRAAGAREVDPAGFGDPVLRRRDGVFTYNLAVVVDDLRDGVTEVVRGADLLDFTSVQLRLWEALGATPPTWLHAPVLLGPDGKKLSKSHGSTELRAIRAAGASPRDVWRRLLPLLGIDGPEHVAEALSAFAAPRFRQGPLTLPA